MKVLLTNDDGVDAAGLDAMREVLSRNNDIMVVAPKTNCSGYSNSITLSHDVRVLRREENVWEVDGTPTDCVRLAYSGCLGVAPDRVISGVNQGANLSDDILYSGTIAAAIEGRFLEYASIAVSAVSLSRDAYLLGAHFAASLLEETINRSELKGLTLSVNVPSPKERPDVRLMRADFHKRNGVPRTSAIDPSAVGEFSTIPLPVPAKDRNAEITSDVGIVLSGGASLSVHDGFSEIHSQELPLSDIINAVNTSLPVTSIA